MKIFWFDTIYWVRLKTQDDDLEDDIELDQIHFNLVKYFHFFFKNRLQWRFQNLIISSFIEIFVTTDLNSNRQISLTSSMDSHIFYLALTFCISGDVISLIDDQTLHDESMSTIPFYIVTLIIRREELSDLHDVEVFPNIFIKIEKYLYVHKRFHSNIGLFLSQRKSRLSQFSCQFNIIRGRLRVSLRVMYNITDIMKKIYYRT